ncbi:pyruvate formate lyase family protein [Niameybacter massiliensis]|uniref:pyruvate formate lyase family protein n=1 Tax=Niameybacter massiliensis TaxID=1658108 RepID=UPI0006B5DD33|nr:pyruvate formate lyase family protein [Niameybacter massiliensis]
MQKSERTQMLERLWTEKGKRPPKNNYQSNLHYAAINLYSKLPQWEKIARATHYALVNQAVYIEDYDEIIGRVYWGRDKAVEERAKDLECLNGPFEKVREAFEFYDEMCHNQLFSAGGSRGHIAWLWDRILKHGVSGMRQMYTTSLKKAKDEKAKQFYTGVLIVLDAITQWNQKHIEKLKEMNRFDKVAICERVPEYPAVTFKEAVQAYYFQHIMVLSENPYGGNSPGRLDYYLWPYLENDLKKGICTLEEARVLIDELFLRFDESVHTMDGWGITISIGGSHKNGTSAVNPLTYIMIESIIAMNITHPLVYLRIPKNPPEEYIKLCAKYLKEGNNRAQILSDEAIIKAMINSGVRYSDATEYVCGGCMEISPQGMNSDYLFNGWHNIPKLVELAITGGKCLVTGKHLQSTQFKGLTAFTQFEEFYNDFEKEVLRMIHIFFHTQDVFSEEDAKSRPAYLLSSMLDDCLTTGRNMHDGGVRYHNYGSAPIGLPNAADALFAVKKAVFEDKICTAETLIHALETDFENNELLRLRLQNIPKYGQQNQEADEFASRVMTTVCEAYSSYTNRFGGTALPMVLTFTFGVTAAELLGATADGGHAGKMVAHGITPQSSSMTYGLTAAMNSNLSMPTELFTGGASTMWDFDPTWGSEALIEMILRRFIAGGGQIFQGNTTKVDELMKAQENPEGYRHLIVRVGGFSARFVYLNKALQDDIISRYRHKC